jgi:hypothetical protein
MDQVKAAIAGIKRQRFWILCGLTVILAVVAWKIAIGSVTERFDTRKTEIEEHLSKVQKIKNDIDHPNQATIDNLDDQADQLSEEVFAVWKELYRNQEELNPWPEELGPEFIDMVKALPEDQDFSQFRYNEHYQMFIENHLPHLDEIIDRWRPVELKAEGDAEIPDAMGLATAVATFRKPVEYEGVLEWNASNRNTVRARFIWDERPSTTRIRVAQEDLWIYEALLRVIAETNEGATGNFNAAVKKIEYLDIGQDTGGLSQGSQMYGGTGMGMGGTTEEEEDGAFSGYTSPDEDEGMMRRGGLGLDEVVDEAALENTLLKNGRYVDQDGKTLLAEDPHPYAEFKMMPVKLGLVVSQGKISDLLVNCANCTMPIDVRRVNLWSKGGGPFGVTRGRGSRMGMGGMGMGGMGMGGMGMGGLRSGDEDGDTGASGSGAGRRNSGVGMGIGEQRELITLVAEKDIPIEIEAIIYIFNKPAREKLGTGTAEGAATPSRLDSEPATKPGSMPAAPAEATPSTTTPETAPPTETQPPVEAPETAPPTETQPPVEAPETTAANPPSPPVNAAPPAGPVSEATPAAGEEPVTP